MSRFQHGLKYLNYQLKSHSKHKVHSPFVFDIVTELLENPYEYHHYETVEQIRQQLRSSKQVISVTDFGAGSKVFKGAERKVRAIAKHTAKPAKYGQLLFQLVNKFTPKNVVELGTSLGVSTLYMALSNTKAQVYTLEGCPETLKVAQSNFEIMNLDNIQTIAGNFDDTLPGLLEELDQLDFFFVDGNHQQEATLRYFEAGLQKAHENSVFVFDDIHWSEGMEKAWNTIKAHPSVTVTIDLFEMGLVFFRKGQVEEHFTLRY